LNAVSTTSYRPVATILASSSAVVPPGALKRMSPSAFSSASSSSTGPWKSSQSLHQSYCPGRSGSWNEEHVDVVAPQQAQTLLNRAAQHALAARVERLRPAAKLDREDERPRRVRLRIAEHLLAVGVARRGVDVVERRRISSEQSPGLLDQRFRPA